MIYEWCLVVLLVVVMPGIIICCCGVAVVLLLCVVVVVLLLCCVVVVVVDLYILSTDRPLIGRCSNVENSIFIVRVRVSGRYPTTSRDARAAGEFLDWAYDRDLDDLVRSSRMILESIGTNRRNRIEQ
jgi:hypothetical protein